MLNIMWFFFKAKSEFITIRNKNYCKVTAYLWSLTPFLAEEWQPFTEHFFILLWMTLISQFVHTLIIHMIKYYQTNKITICFETFSCFTLLWWSPGTIHGTTVQEFQTKVNVYENGLFIIKFTKRTKWSRNFVTNFFIYRSLLNQ